MSLVEMNAYFCSMRGDWGDQSKKILYQRTIKELSEPLRKQLIAIIQGDDSQLKDDQIKSLAKEIEKNIKLSEDPNYLKLSRRKIGLYKSFCRKISNLYKRTGSRKIENEIFKNREKQDQVNQILKTIDLATASLEDKNKIFHFTRKYDHYNEECCYYLQNHNDVRKGPPLLSSALEVKAFSLEVEADIKEIIRLVPSSVNCTIAAMPFGTEATPLAVACFNGNIPIPMIEYLLEKIPDSRETKITVSGTPELLIDYLKTNVLYITQDRYDQIKVLFDAQKSV